MISLIDTAKWQGFNPWTDYVGRDDIAGAFQKGVHGTTPDPMWKSERERCISRFTAEEFPLGVYGWWVPDADPLAQADALAACQVRDGDLPYVIDVEQTIPTIFGRRQIYANRLRAYANRLQSKTGRVPVIYTGRWYWAETFGDQADDFAIYPLFHAEYTDATVAHVARPWQAEVATPPEGVTFDPPRHVGWTFWQWKNNGVVLEGRRVDVDRFAGSRADLATFIASTHVSGGPLAAPTVQGFPTELTT